MENPPWIFRSFCFFFEFCFEQKSHVVSLKSRCIEIGFFCFSKFRSFQIAPNVPRLCDRAGLLPGIVLLKTLISRIRNLSTEDGFPAWRIAAVGQRFFNRIVFFNL